MAQRLNEDLVFRARHRHDGACLHAYFFTRQIFEKGENVKEQVFAAVNLDFFIGQGVGEVEVERGGDYSEMHLPKPLLQFLSFPFNVELPLSELVLHHCLSIAGL
jgi:hypothetical protein